MNRFSFETKPAPQKRNFLDLPVGAMFVYKETLDDFNTVTSTDKNIYQKINNNPSDNAFRISSDGISIVCFGIKEKFFFFDNLDLDIHVTIK